MALSVPDSGYSGYDSTPGTTPAITGLSSAAGDKMVLLFWDYLGTNLTTAANISDSAANTYTCVRLEATVFPGYYAYCDLASSVTDVSVSNSGGAYGNRIDLVAIVLRGAKTGAPGWTAHQYTGGNTMDPGSLTSSGNNTAYFMFGASLGTWSSSSGGTALETSNNGGIKALWQTGAPGAYQLTETLTGGNLTAAIAIAFEEQGGTSLPDLTWQGRFTDPDRRDKRREMQAFAGLGKPERNIVYFDAFVPPAVSRPSLIRAAHLAAPSAPIDRKAPYADAIVPDRALRARMNPAPLPERPPYVDRNAPLTPVAYPDSVPRPSFAAAQQWATSAREWVLEAPLPEPCVLVPPRVARPALLAAIQQAFSDPTYAWGLAPPAPTLSWQSTWRDAVPRPSFAAAEQQAQARAPLPDTSLPAAMAIVPASVRRPALGAHQQQALARWPLPDTSLPAAFAIVPATTLRARIATAEVPAYFDPTLSWNLQPVAPTLSWNGTWPDAVLRQHMRASLQQAHSLPPKPERPAPIAAVQHPDRVLRLYLATSAQQASPHTPQDRSSVLVAVSFADRVPRPAMPTAAQLFYAGLGVPIVPAPVPNLVSGAYPDMLAHRFMLLMAGATMPPWRYTNPVTPGKRGRATPGDVILSRGTASDSTGATGDPSDE